MFSILWYYWKDILPSFNGIETSVIRPLIGKQRYCGASIRSIICELYMVEYGNSKNVIPVRNYRWFIKWLSVIVNPSLYCVDWVISVVLWITRLYIRINRPARIAPAPIPVPTVKRGQWLRSESASRCCWPASCCCSRSKVRVSSLFLRLYSSPLPAAPCNDSVVATYIRLFSRTFAKFCLKSAIFT